MKYIVLLGDGMSDEPLEELEGRTPLQAARTPNMDFMAKRGTLGLVRTVPDGFPPGSDVANLSIFGYDPMSCYTGRSPLEAASIGIPLGENDVAFRLNLVTLDEAAGSKRMADYSAGHITTDEGRQLLIALNESLGSEEFQFYPGVSYRHLLVWRGGKDSITATPPHDISGKPIQDYLPTGDGSEVLLRLMEDASRLLVRHPLYQARLSASLRPANAIWLWGHGKAPRMQSFRDKFGLTGAVISAVDLIRGIGISAGLDIIKVEGATGYLDTNYEGKVAAALTALQTHDYVYLHVEAADEASHSGNLGHKIQAIEDFDSKIVGPLLSGIGRFGSYRVLCTPDHPTPLRLKTHTSDPVPFILYSGEQSPNAAIAGYDETSARNTKIYIDNGSKLMERLLERSV